MSCDFESVRAIAQELPGAEEGTSYGTPAFRVRKKLFARLHQDGESLVLCADLDARDVMLKSDPEVFYITDHYRSDPYILVRLGSVEVPQLREIVIHAWRQRAPRTLVQAFEDTGSGSHLGAPES